MIAEKLGLFKGEDKPTPEICWEFYEDGLEFNANIRLEDNVQVNENFYIGKQWEGVQTNGLPTPQVNFMKRVVGFIVATITSDNIKVTASALANTVGTSGYKDLINIVNDEYEAIIEQNNLPFLVREYARNAAVDGDGCLYTYWDADAETGQKAKGRIKTEVIENTRVFFGDPNDRNVQSQPYIIMAKRELIRNVKLRAKANGLDYTQIMTDEDESDGIDWVKRVNDDNKVTTILTFWRDDNTDTIWCYESTQNAEIRKPWDMGIKLYPFTWLNWDYIQDSYHGQAMLTGLVPNQVFVNKSNAMVMVSIMKSAFSKVLFDATRIKKWDNRVGSAIPINGGNVNDVAKIIDPAPISPQISQWIQMTIEQTEQSLGATSVALGDARPDNTSAIIALQRAAATPSEMTKQNIYKSIEDLFRIYLDFIGEYYGKRYVDVPPTSQEKMAVEFAQQMNPDLEMPDEVPVLFDFSVLKDHPVKLKLDVGASTYYSEVACINTLDNLLAQGHISMPQYLERVPDYIIPGRRALLEEIKRQEEEQQAMMMQQQGMGAPPMAGEATADLGQKMDIPNTEGGYGALQRAINESGDTKGIV